MELIRGSLSRIVCAKSIVQVMLLLLSKVLLAVDSVPRKKQIHAFVRVLISPLGRVGVSVSLLQMEM